jgi:hypothetical protein
MSIPGQLVLLHMQMSREKHDNRIHIEKFKLPLVLHQHVMRTEIKINLHGLTRCGQQHCLSARVLQWERDERNL